MSLSLYEIDRKLEDLIDPETGEVKDYEAFEAVQMARDEKIESVACWTKSLDAEAKAIRAEELALSERRKSLEKKRERLLEYLDKALDGNAFKSARCSVTYRRTPPRVEITNMDELVHWCLANGHDGIVQYSAPTVAKSDISMFLKSGIPVDGAELSTSMKMGVS